MLGVGIVGGVGRPGNTRGQGGPAWAALGGSALRVGGQTLNVLSQPLVVEPRNA
jgi:hypothetical protein